jgi:UDPglucose 6-dehydrogenase
MRLVMVGSGYVGLVTGACLADFGYEVTCADSDGGKIARLQQGEMPIFEPGLKELVAKGVRQGRLAFTNDLAAAIPGAEAIFIAVGTPSLRGDGYADLSYVYVAAKEVARAMTGYAVIVTKSTVPVGTGDEVERIIRATRPELDFAVVSNPEFLREGAAIEDFKRPDRIVVGANDERSQEVMARVYRPLYLNKAPIVFTDRRTSEVTKYAANAFLAAKITFINEMADLCEAVDANVQEVARGIGLYKRIGGKFLHAGPGYGGSCFPKDTLALIKTAQDHAVSLSIVEATARANDVRKRGMARRIIVACGGDVRGKTIALLGLTFKPNTDDMRDAPSIAISQALLDHGARVTAYDPEGAEQARLVMPGINYANDIYECLSGADAMCLVTEWDAFRAIDLVRVKALLREPVIVDLRNVYAPEDMARLGFRYFSIGRHRSARDQASADALTNQA